MTLLIDNETRPRAADGHAIGGAEAVALLNSRVLKEYPFHTFADSDYGDCRLPFYSVEWHKKQGNKQYYRTKEWEKWASKLRADVIVSHIIKTTPINAFANVFPHKLVQFEFRSPGGQMDITKLDIYERILKAGGQIVFVSQRQLNIWNAFSDRLKGYEMFKDSEVVTHVVYKHKQIDHINNKLGKPIIVARANKEKNIVPFLKHWNKPLTFILAEDDDDYHGEQTHTSSPCMSFSRRLVFSYSQLQQVRQVTAEGGC